MTAEDKKFLHDLVLEYRIEGMKPKEAIEKAKNVLMSFKKEKPKNKTFEDGVNIARKTVLGIVEKYKDKESDDLQEDLKNEINKALDKILEELF